MGKRETSSNGTARTKLIRRFTLGEDHLAIPSSNPTLAGTQAASALIARGSDSIPVNLRFALVFYDRDRQWLGTWHSDTLQIALDKAREIAGIAPDEWEEVSQTFVDVPVISDYLLGQLRRVPPTADGRIEYRPCRVRLHDGSWRERVYVEDVEGVDLGGISPAHGERVDFSDIVEIAESEQRLPAAIANALYEAGESAMGGCWFVLITRSGVRIPCHTGNNVDFIDLPGGVASGDIVDVEPRVDEARTARRPVGALEHAWSVYANST